MSDVNGFKTIEKVAKIEKLRPHEKMAWQVIYAVQLAVIEYKSDRGPSLQKPFEEMEMGDLLDLSRSGRRYG